jgi:heat shock protein HslJ
MKLRHLIVIAAALSLPACATLSEKPYFYQSAPAIYKAQGTEPFWILEIKNDRMLFSGINYEKDLVEYGVVSGPSANGWRQVSKTITSYSTLGPCIDGMSDRTYADTVTVMIGKETYKGCGGRFLDPASLESTTWRIASINGAEIPTTQGALVSFGDGRMSGTVGCNRLGSDYTYSNGKLGFGPVMSTRMACQEPLTTQEYAFVSLLGTSPATSFTINGALVLTGKDGSVAILEQSI